MKGHVPRWLLARPIAHRGLHDRSVGAPENSLPAFEAAAAAGFPSELDVRVSRDGIAVVVHDADLDRLTHASGPVAAMESDELRRLRIGDSDCHLPLLSDVLEAVDARAPLLVEVKNEGVAGAVERATMAALDGYDGEIAVQSFNPLTLQWFANHAPGLTRGLLSGDFRDVEMNDVLRQKLRDLEMIDIAASHFIGYDVRCLPFAPVTAAREQGTPVLGWTVTSPEMEADRRRFCDNVIFEGYIPKG
jgi:glycerophosphoryl diester phosphodiesterase